MSKLKLNTEVILFPTAHIAVNKSRLKLYNGNSTYYMKNGTEFQIELFNPTTGNVLAKIQLNGKLITQGGLVIKPGQRVFFERYLDVAKKFLFETYEVSGTNDAVKAAIENNGDIKIEFYTEKQTQLYPLINITPSWGNIYYGDLTCDYTTTVSPATNLITSDFNNYNTSIDIASSNPTLDGVLRSNPRGLSKQSKSVETGRIEKGSDSSQEFQTVNMQFNSWAASAVIYKLLPISQKINTTYEIQAKLYCTECGAKQKKGFKFCPVCGNKN